MKIGRTRTSHSYQATSRILWPHMEEILTKTDNKIIAAGVLGVLSLPFWMAILFVALQIYA